MAKRTTTLKQKLAIVEELKASLTKNDDGTHSYAEGVNDAVIAGKCGVASVNVASIRRELYGHLAPPPKQGIHAEIEALRKRVERIEATLSGYTGRL